MKKLYYHAANDPLSIEQMAVICASFNAILEHIDDEIQRGLTPIEVICSTITRAHEFRRHYHELIKRGTN